MKRKNNKRVMNYIELPPPFDGWQANQNGLFSPEGCRFQPGDIRAMRWLRAEVAELRRIVKEPQQYRLL